MPRLSELSFQGRLSRKAFWGRHLLVLPAGLAIVLHVGTGLANLAGAVLLTIWLVSVWARRLHDRGLSAWWLLVVLIPVAGAAWLWWQCGARGSALSESADAPPSLDYLTVRS